MKYLCLICLPVFLSGCALSSTEKPANSSPSINDQSISEQSIAEEIQLEGVADVIHPAELVEVPLPEPFEKEVSAPNNVWLHIADQLEFKIPQNQSRLESQKRWYLEHPEYMARVATRARPFLYYIVEQLERHDVPVDIALLPIVESAFDPFAYSSGRAAGMWQFIPSTGKRFGMPQNWWYDGRRDVVASTQGAIDYLKYLNNMFDGNWLHALAAYNSGEGRVQRAIRKNQRLGKSTDFWSLDLPRETRAYVPKLLALADILKQSEKYDFNWPEIDNAPVIHVVEVGSQIDLAMAAQMADLKVSELQALNPGFNKWATDPNGPHRLVLPIDKVTDFTLALNNTPENKRLNWERHTVKRGDSIGKIAQRYNTNMDVIKRINNLNGNTIYAGDKLLVPVALTNLNAYALSAAQNSYHPGRTTRGKTKTHHIVKAGDTLSDIAHAYDVSITQLSRWNRMSRNDTLSLGKRLVIWSGEETTDITRSLTYKVRKGESLSVIADKFNVDINDIVRWNALSKSKYLQPGQPLKLKIDITKS
jgi:membrane-bound lytic murein transglycosylase D